MDFAPARGRFGVDFAPARGRRSPWAVPIEAGGPEGLTKKSAADATQVRAVSTKRLGWEPGAVILSSDALRKLPMRIIVPMVGMPPRIGGIIDGV